MKIMAKHFSQFLRDERGGYTAWSLCWFMIYCALGGLAVDVTDAYRNQAVLQSTADSAALAAAMTLPDQDQAVAAAVANSGDNMGASANGIVLKPSDITFGTWDAGTRRFATGGIAPNAVRVVTRRSAENANPVSMNLLRIAALFGVTPEWNIVTDAIALRYVPACINDGFIALNRVDINSGNTLRNRICLHGQRAGVDLQNHNSFEPGVKVGMADLDMLPDRGNLFDMNPGLAAALVEGDLYPRDVDFVGFIIEGLRKLDPNHIPDFMYRTDANGNAVPPQKVTGNDLPATLAEFTVYDITCNGQLKLPKDLISKVVIVADCRIHSSAGTNLQDVVLASSHLGNTASIDMAAQSVLGRPDGCAPGGGVEFYTLGDVHIAAQGDWHGLRVVAGRDVEMTANNVGIHGMSVQAGRNIGFTSNNEFALCDGAVPGRFAWHYRLVH